SRSAPPNGRTIQIARFVQRQAAPRKPTVLFVWTQERVENHFRAVRRNFENRAIILGAASFRCTVEITFFVFDQTVIWGAAIASGTERMKNRFRPVPCHLEENAATAARCCAVEIAHLVSDQWPVGGRTVVRIPELMERRIFSVR